MRIDYQQKRPSLDVSGRLPHELVKADQSG